MNMAATANEIETEVVDAVAHDDHHHEEVISTRGLMMIYAFLAVVVVAWGTAIFLFGIPGLYMPAVALVPVIYLLLVIVAKG